MEVIDKICVGSVKLKDLPDGSMFMFVDPENDIIKKFIKTSSKPRNLGSTRHNADDSFLIYNVDKHTVDTCVEDYEVIPLKSKLIIGSE